MILTTLAHAAGHLHGHFEIPAALAITAVLVGVLASALSRSRR